MSLMPNELVARVAWDQWCANIGLPPDPMNFVPANSDSVEAVRHARLEIALELRAMGRSAEYWWLHEDVLEELADKIESAAQEEL